MSIKQRTKNKKFPLYGKRQMYINGHPCVDVYIFVGYAAKNRGDDNWWYGKILDY